MELVQVIFIEQFADVIASKCSIWHKPTTADRMKEIPYEEILKIKVGDILEMINCGSIYYKTGQE